MNNNPSNTNGKNRTYYLPITSIEKLDDLSRSLGLNKSHTIDLLITHFDTLLFQHLHSLDITVETKAILLRRLNIT